MKKLFAAAVFATTLLAAGCFKQSGEKPDHIAYLGVDFINLTVSFTTDDAGLKALKIMGGSRDAYNNDSIDNASFLELVLNLGYPADGEWEWEGEHNLENTSTKGHIEYARKWRDELWEPKHESFNHPILSGSVAIEHIEGDKYKITFEGTALADSDIFPVSAKISNSSVQIVTPEE